MNELTLELSLQEVQESDDGTELCTVRSVLGDEITNWNGQERSEVLQNKELSKSKLFTVL